MYTSKRMEVRQGLIKATPEDIKKYGEFAYSVALNPKKSCYPTYADGIKTKTDFFKAAERAIAKETYELLLFGIDGKVEGWISYYWIPEDRYLQLYEFNINRGTKQALAELLKTIETKFAGYTAYFGFPGDNQEAIQNMVSNALSRTGITLFSLMDIRRRNMMTALKRFFDTILISSEGYITKIPTPTGMPTVSLKRLMIGRSLFTIRQISQLLPCF